MNEVNAVQVGGSHYKGTTYQHWDFVQAALGGRYLEGNITKYVTRHRKKNGLQDLQKARHYLTKLIDEYNVGNVTPLQMTSHRLAPHQTSSHFCDVNGVDVNERNFIMLVSNWCSRSDLHIAGKMLDAMIDKEQYADEEARSGGGYTSLGDPMRAAHIEARGQVVNDNRVMLPMEATDEMAKSVDAIVSAYAAKKVWKRMVETALFAGEATSGYVDQG